MLLNDNSCKFAVALLDKMWYTTVHRSLDKFLAKYSDWVDEPCLFWDRDLAVKDGILHLPLCMAPLI